MNRPRTLAGLLLALITLVVFAAPSSAAPSTPPPAVTVAFDHGEVRAAVGERFTLRARISDISAAPVGPSIAHLNVASLTSDVYVDPEDWSSDRSRPVAAMAAGDGTWLDWEIQAVTAGRFDVYVVVLPTGPDRAGSGGPGPAPLVASAPVHVTVTPRRTLTAGGSLPTAITVPLLLGAGALATRRRARRASNLAQTGGPKT
ncbi:hypothetical protein [Pseudofrankia inefficax]|uniref:Uncharacterized protein n=1 Tax=Pseudofrankia inefficax (strain DSM 45817 / CECT 9037 / DDB 130130 / EuI1c) TaxID=298654 RepID=E3J7X5_PSEI1|nr:hypothetical protein [Pseudofrankia inefficax]ADP82023.1 hypothetical protein FraEuI1c_4019 [Pseudofrankia inefficax]